MIHSSKLFVAGFFAALFSANLAFPVNRLFMENQTIHLGDKGVSVPVKLDNDAQRHGFSLSIKYDPVKLELKSVEVAGTSAAGAGWSMGTIYPTDGELAWSVIMGFNQGPPAGFDGNKLLPAGTGITVARLVFDVAAGAATGITTVILQDGLGEPPVKNLLTTDGLPVVPQIGAPALINIQPAVTDVQFLRGDFNLDNDVDISDAIGILTYAFLGGTRPSCLDRGDVDDSGDIDVTDAVNILEFNFLGAQDKKPKPPFPAAGTDPTPDSLQCS